MFTGIITDIGSVKAITPRENGLCVTIATAYDTHNMAIGCSISHDGVCLTVVEKGEGEYKVDVSEETLSCTTLGHWQKGTKVNLEHALKVGDELGGHMVSGHVDGFGVVNDIVPVGDNITLKITAPEQLKKYIAAKGSITVNGVSLTVNRVDGNKLELNIIAHTLSQTTLGDLQIGDKVNLEIDMVARYVYRLNQCS